MPLPEEKHRFKPRSKGTPVACEVCGATKGDPVHLPFKQPVPG